MKYYFSGDYYDEAERYLIEKKACRLLSFAYLRKVFSYLKLVDEMGVTGLDIMIDSGAFTVWNAGGSVDLLQLMDFQKKLVDMYSDKHNFVFISLDVIPGSVGVTPTQQQIEESVHRSVENFHTMKGTGIDVLPVYHSGEDDWVKRHYMEHCDYLCLSMSQNLSEKQRVTWAMENQVDGFKMHGLAATGAKMMRYVDWYSIDSAGWIMVSAMGGIMVPKETGELVPVMVSSQSPQTKTWDKHITNRYDAEFIKQKIIEQGFDLEALATDPVQRGIWNAKQILELNVTKNVMTIQGLF